MSHVARPQVPHRLIAASGGFLGPSPQAKRIRRILELAVQRPQLGWPRAEDAILAWGHSPRAYRAEALAKRTGAPIWRVEDAFLRSIHPARAKAEPTLGLVLDREGIYYDPSTPSELERFLINAPLDDGNLLARARICIERIRALHLSKYNIHDPQYPAPAPGYVLIVDQVRDDASLRHGGRTGPLDADRLFRQMLFQALDEHPAAPILIRSHPETRAGLRGGHFDPSMAQDRIAFLDGPHSPWALLDGAIAVYTVSSQMGFEAILAGHRPKVFGTPFYAGWGLSEDQDPMPRRQRALTRSQLFAAAMMAYPFWYDPYRDRLCELEDVIDTLEAQVTAFRQDRDGYVASGMRAWKRPAMQAFFGREKPVVFVSEPAKAYAKDTGRKHLTWGLPSSLDGPAVHVEDGFLRSRGLGADLVPPLSLCLDDMGIYYDPARPSRLETLIARPLPAGGAARAEALRARILSAGITKYNLDGGDDRAAVEALKAARPHARVILVPGQVEDDASIRLGTQNVCTNAALLQETRKENPDAILLYKPHPDVKAGLRPGEVDPTILEACADLVLTGGDAHSALSLAESVWTMTSGIGFEALLRGVPVTCLGVPFYAGWGLTDDRATIPERRRNVYPRPTLEHLIHASLIDYPRYVDPVTRLPCPPEVAVVRLAEGKGWRQGLRLRSLSKLQGWFAGHAHVWRR